MKMFCSFMPVPLHRQYYLKNQFCHIYYNVNKYTSRQLIYTSCIVVYSIFDEDNALLFQMIKGIKK